MLIFTKVDELQNYLMEVKTKGLSLGFVPTMGALHQGHISLIESSKSQCDITICSIFVNPRQFNDQSDLKRYPRTPEKDSELLEKADCSVLFLPSVEEIYPANTIEKYDFGHLDSILEAKYRPGHFNGVAQVLKRFFELIQPTKAFFGIKDYQQVMIVKALVQKFLIPVEIISCPILREPDGLAMSSRNTLLNSEERKTAALIPRILTEARNMLTHGATIAKTKQFVTNEVGKYPSMQLDYFDICIPDTLLPSKNKKKGQNHVLLIALYVGKIRLIDNYLLE